MDKPKEMIGKAGVKEKTEKGVYLEHFLYLQFFWQII